MDVGPFVVPDAQPAELIQPSERPLDDPAPPPLEPVTKLRQMPLLRRDSSVSSGGWSTLRDFSGVILPR